MFNSTWKSRCHLCRFIKKLHRTGRFNMRRGLRQVGSPMRGYGGSSLLEFTHNRWSLTQPWEGGEALFCFSLFQTEEVVHSFVYKHLLMGLMLLLVRFGPLKVPYSIHFHFFSFRSTTLNAFGRGRKQASPICQTAAEPYGWRHWCCPCCWPPVSWPGGIKGIFYICKIYGW